MMKFLIQQVNNRVVHDFAFVLLEAIGYQHWRGNTDIEYKFIENYEFKFETDNPTIVLDNNGTTFDLREYYKSFTPIGTVEFVCNFIRFVYGDNYVPKPINIPRCLLHEKYTKRDVRYATLDPITNNLMGKYFVKNIRQIKSDFNGAYNFPMDNKKLPYDTYIISDMIDIDSEYRCFVYKNELVGIQYYSGDFTIFPDVNFIKETIDDYSRTSEVPIAYTLDVGVNSKDGTFIIEIHDFFSCGLYGFSDLTILPYMFNRWFKEYINNKNKLYYEQSKNA